MFDMGILEIAVVLVITLLVVGPERMPEVARKAGQMLAKVRNFINSVKDDSNLRDAVRELQDAVDLKEQKQNLEHIKKDLTTGFDDIKDQINFDELQRPFSDKSLPNSPTQEQLDHASTQLESTNDVPEEQPIASEKPSPTASKSPSSREQP